jgi:peptide/nickel transport system permease protein
VPATCAEEREAAGYERVLAFIAKRLCWTAMLLAVISLLLFLIFIVIPNTAASKQGLVETNLQTQWNLQARSLPSAYLHWADRVVLHGDFGHSLRQPASVKYLIEQTFPVTLSLIIGGTIIWLLIAFPVGLISALRPRSLMDRSMMVFVLIGISAHPVWLGLLFSYIFGFKLHWFPIGGYCDFRYHPLTGSECGGPRYWAYHMILPWLTFALLFAALYARMIRASVLEALDEEYVRTARAKGAGEWRIVFRHVIRNAMLPIVTMLGMDIGLAFGGALFIETAFDLPGTGQLLYQSLPSTDLPVIMGIALVVATGVALCNLVADLLYCLIDPRIGLQSSGAGEVGAVVSQRLRPRAQPQVSESISS